MWRHLTKILALLLNLSLLSSMLGGCAGEKEEQPPEGTAEVQEEGSLKVPGEISAYDTRNSDYGLTVDAGNQVHEISDLLFGIFIEDINFAADGGLYAELVQNRSFEFTAFAQGDEKHAWSDVGKIEANVAVDDLQGCLNPNNTNYMVMRNASQEPAGIANRGFLDGIAVTEGAGYDFSVWAKGLEGYVGPLYVDIMVNGESAAHGEIPALSGEWAKYELELVCAKTASPNVSLQVTMDRGAAAVDMVSLFPQDTFKGRKNGLRKDLGEKLEALQPRFLRFPGGCVIEGLNLDVAYNWKDSIGADENGDPLLWNGTYGDVAARRQGQDIWTNVNTSSDPYPSFMSYGLGFYEYFLLAEDIGAVGVPVLNCGMACTVRGGNIAPLSSEEMQGFIQDALDLVEFCRGGGDTEWGAVRTAMGHPEPFALKYIGIGNEQWGNNYFQHYSSDTLDQWEEVSDGIWSVEDGKLVQADTATNTGAYSSTGSALYFGDTDWTNYTLTLDATKTGGLEGFLIPFAVQDKDNNYFWNIGGWNNTVSALQRVSSGAKTDQIGSTSKKLSIKTGQTYQLKVVVTPENVKCYVDGGLYVNYSPAPVTKADAYEVASTDESGDIILKLVNVTGESRTFAVDIQNAHITSDTAEVEQAAGASLQDDNILGREPVVTLESSTAAGVSDRFNYTVPKYSVTVLRIKTK